MPVSVSAMQPRKPEASGQISKNLILGCALAEATAIYGFLIGILLIFMN